MSTKEEYALVDYVAIICAASSITLYFTGWYVFYYYVLFNLYSKAFMFSR